MANFSQKFGRKSGQKYGSVPVGTPLPPRWTPPPPPPPGSNQNFPKITPAEIKDALIELIKNDSDIRDLLEWIACLTPEPGKEKK